MSKSTDIILRDDEEEVEDIEEHSSFLSKDFIDKNDRQLPIDRRCFGTKFCFAGGEERALRNGMYRIGISHVLFSFFYLKKFLRKRKAQEILEDLGRFDYVILDSGAFTFMQAIKDGKDLGMDIVEYADLYHSELERIGHLFTACAELDVHEHFSKNEMEDTRDYLTGRGVTMLPVIQGHPMAELNDLGWFDKYPYIAIGSGMINNKKHVSDIRDIFIQAKKKGTLIHGFGVTDTESIRKYPYWSVDSSVDGDSVVWVKRKDHIIRVSISDLFEYFSHDSGVSEYGTMSLAEEGMETLTVLGDSESEYTVGWSRLAGVVKHVVKKRFLEIKIKTGRTLKVTGDHSLFIMDKDGNFIETKPTDLKVGDWIVCPRNFKWSGKGISHLSAELTVPTQGVFKSGVQKTKKEYIEVELTKDMLELFGYWIGNGSYGGETRINFSCGVDKEVTKKVCAFAESLGRKATVSKKNDVSVSHYLFSRAMREWDFSHGAHNKHLPYWFWDLSIEQAASFLRGMFTADGSGGLRPYYSTVSERLSMEVNDAVSSIIEEPTSRNIVGYDNRVSITSNRLKKKFEDRIGFFTDNRMVEFSSSDRVPRTDYLPTVLASGELIRNNGNKVYTDFVERGIPGFKKSVESSDLVYLKIVSIEELPLEEREVYDLDVPETQKFIANGILAHNTTWMSGSRYGNTMIFQNGKLRYYDHHKKSVRRRYKRRFEENGLDWESIENEKYIEVDLMNGLGWKQWADYIKYNVSNAYWLTPEEKDEALTLKSKVFNTEGLIDRSASLARAEARRLTEVSDADYDDRAHETLYCDICHLNGKCPRFKVGESCGYDINIRLQNTRDVQKAVQTLLEVAYGRVMTGAVFEKLEGGVLDNNVSKEFANFLDMTEKAKRIFAQPIQKEEIEIKASGKSSGVMSRMLAGVFANRGEKSSGSGNTQTERAANKIIDIENEDSED